MKQCFDQHFLNYIGGSPKRSLLPAILGLGILLGPGSRQLSAQETVAKWSFEQFARSTTLEEVSKQPDRIVGFYEPVAGIGGGAIQLDGYTSFLERARFGRDLPQQFTVNAWLALESYPWFRSPVFDLRRAEKDGVLLAVNHSGKLAVGLGQPATWVEIEGPLLPLKQWLMLTLVVESERPARLYLNGQPVGEAPSSPVLSPTSDHKLTMGRNAMLEKWVDYQ